MTSVVDTSVLIDFLRGNRAAAALLEREAETERLHGSELSRLEVLAGVRPHEEAATRAFLATLIWHAVDAQISERAGVLGREWLVSHPQVHGADLAVAATADILTATLLTRNVDRFPMIPGLSPAY